MSVESACRRCANVNKNGCSGCLYERYKGNCFSKLAKDAAEELKTLKREKGEGEWNRLVNGSYREMILLEEYEKYLVESIFDLLKHQIRNPDSNTVRIDLSQADADRLCRVMWRVNKIAKVHREQSVQRVTFDQYEPLGEGSVPTGDRITPISEEDLRTYAERGARVVFPANRRISDEDIRRIIEQGSVHVDPTSDEAIAQNRAVRVPASYALSDEICETPPYVRSVESQRNRHGEAAEQIARLLRNERSGDEGATEAVAAEDRNEQRNRYREVHVGSVDCRGATDPWGRTAEEREWIARSAREGFWGPSASDAPSETSAASTENQT